MKSNPSTAGKPLNPVVHKSRGDDVENRKKKLKKTSSTSGRLLNSRNDAAAKTESGKRKSDEMTKSNTSADQEDHSGCPKPKKPSPKHSVSV